MLCPKVWTTIVTGIISEYYGRSGNSHMIWQPLGSFQKASWGPPMHVSLDTQLKGRIYHIGRAAPYI